MNIKYTKELLEPIVNSSISVADVMRKLNMNCAGGSHAHLARRIKYFKLDTTHFTGQGWRRGKRLPVVSASDALVLRTDGTRQRAYILRRCLIDSGVEYKCSICGIDPVWNDKELRLQVDHINRNWLDDRLENLRFVCPNCHSQTDGYSGSKGKTNLTSAFIYSKMV